VNNAGVLIPADIKDSRRYFAVVIHAGVLISAGMEGMTPGFSSSTSTLLIQQWSTRHALVIKIRNECVPTSCQLMPNRQQHTPMIYNP
jgi:uncharacterized membrane protein